MREEGKELGKSQRSKEKKKCKKEREMWMERKANESEQKVRNG